MFVALQQQDNVHHIAMSIYVHRVATLLFILQQHGNVHHIATFVYVRHLANIKGRRNVLIINKGSTLIKN
jgi:hypothetical protein